MCRDPHCAQILGLFADILDYPTPGLADKAAECGALVGRSPPAAEMLESFRAFAEATPLGKLEEIYSGFFDLNPVCHPYIGYQLFGENYKRSSFLLGLKQHYYVEAFEAAADEIPDRLSIVLRYIACSKGTQGSDDLVREGLLPALGRMTTRPESAHAPHDGPGDFDGDTGVERKQLEGHGRGEPLAGGFVLELGADSESTGVADQRPHPYHQALEALRVVLHDNWQA